MNTLQTLDPTMGTLLECWWPEDESPNQTGPKFRPVFFLATKVIKGQLHYIVAYGTSQANEHNEARNGGDFMVPAASNQYYLLKKDTRFDFNKVKAVPATAEYFCSNKTDSKIKAIKVDRKLERIIGEAAVAARLPRQLAALGVQF